MAGRLTRFLNLERARKPGDTPPHRVVNKERFSGEEPPPIPEEAFRAERAAQLESGVEIDAHPDSEQPFLRCPLCEADNTRFAVKCLNCQSRLDTAEVHLWNARFWAARQEALAAEIQTPAAQLPGPDAADAQRLLGEAFAQEVAERERARLLLDDRTPLGLRLLQRIADPNLRFAAALAMVLTFFGSGLVALAEKKHPFVQTVSIAVAAALLFFILPRRSPGSRGLWEDDD